MIVSMPDKREHRGRHPEDNRLFAEEKWVVLRLAANDLSWLLERDYAMTSSLKLVGDHFNLTQRQRMALMRSSCGQSKVKLRQDKLVAAAKLAGTILEIDGYNVLTTIEAALANGVILGCKDGCLRDIASMHGSFRKVQETEPALEMIGQFLAKLGVSQCIWYLDKPVSNSGRLKTLMREMAENNGWPWQIELVNSPDGVLARSEHIIITSDSEILNRCRQWYNLVRAIIEKHIPEAYIVDLIQS